LPSASRGKGQPAEKKLNRKSTSKKTPQKRIKIRSRYGEVPASKGSTLVTKPQGRGKN